jgi:hypothetical protein
LATENNDGTAAKGKVEFIQYHQPGLKDGVYKIRVAQEIHSNETGSAAQRVPLSTFTEERTFAVRGERFSLPPELIQAVFPADGSLGEHSNVLPHVILTRSTLPWERTPLAEEDAAHEDLPWLALLLFDDEEKPEPSVITLGELRNPSGEAGKFPTVGHEVGQTDKDKLTVIEVEKGLLQKLLPSTTGLAFLAHVRAGKDENGAPDGEETAVVICDRLPKKGASSTCHLVSLEGRLVKNPDAGEGKPDEYPFDYQGAGDTETIRLVSLKSWSFACADEKQSFVGLIENLNGQFKDPGTLRLPPNGDAEAEAFLASGFVPLPHLLRQSEKTVSWYHGPLIPGENDSTVELPALAADQLARYDPARGMFDVSYAAAWELGRLLALQSKQLSVSLYNWKRANAQQLKQAEQQLLHPHLPPLGQEAAPPETPDDIAAWFADLALLRGVPFNYLVPDERMLPAESGRFFRLDGMWVDCLLDGAFSIGRVTQTDYEQTQSQKESLTAGGDEDETITGLLLRSALVAGWPGLIVDAYDAAGNKLDSTRTERLSDSVLLCLFKLKDEDKGKGDGVLSRAEIHQRPEMTHFGLDAVDDGYTKKLRDANGAEVGPVISSDSWLHAQTRVVDVDALAAALKEGTKIEKVTSAQFALQMIEGVKRVTLYAEGAVAA